MLAVKASQMIIFLDQPLDERRLKLASMLQIAVIVSDGDQFALMNPDDTSLSLRALFGVNRRPKRGVGTELQSVNLFTNDSRL